jgi:hypothetical protein
MWVVTSRFGGVVVSVLPVRAKVLWFKHDRGNGLLRAIKICTASSFGGKVNPETTSWKILRHVKNHLQVGRRILRKAISSFPSHILPTCSHMTLVVGLPESSSGRIRSFFQSESSFQQGSPSSFITLGINNRLVGVCSSETYSYSMKIRLMVMIIITIIMINLLPTVKPSHTILRKTMYPSII